MKQVAIFDDFYTDSQKLEDDVNVWIKQGKLNDVDIDIKTYISAFNDETCGDGTVQTVNCIVFYAVVTYEDKNQ